MPASTFLLLSVTNFFVGSLDEITKRLKLSPEVTGATFMAVGSSAPELFTSLFAVFRVDNTAGVGAGTIVGSAIFNILVIIGASAVFKAAKLTWQPIIRDLLFYCFSIVLLLLTFMDGQIVLLEALTFVLLYVVYIFTVASWRKLLKYNDAFDPEEEVEHEVSKNPVAKILGLVIPNPSKGKHNYIVTFALSIALIAGLSHVLVEAGVGIGHSLNISPTIIALTILAAGTSIPDLLSSIIVAKRGHGDMAITNAVGSNIFDILFGLGFPWLLLFLFRGAEWIPVDNENLGASIFLLFATVTAVIFVLALRKWKIGPKVGWVLVAIYVLYLLYNVFSVIV